MTMEKKSKILIGVLIAVIIVSSLFAAQEMDYIEIIEDDDDKDDNGGSNPVVDEKPAAAIDVSSTRADINEVVSFDANGSFDRQTNISSYHWDFDDGNTETNVTVDHSWISHGAYNVTLTVEDTDGNSNFTFIYIGVTQTEHQDGNTNGDTETYDFDMEDMATTIYVNTTLENGNSNVGENDVTIRLYFGGTVVDEQTVVLSGGGTVVVGYSNQTNLTAGTWTWELVVNDSGLVCDIDWDVDITILYA